MLANDLISDDIPPLKVSDTGEKALRWMDEFRVAHLPVVNGTEFVGIVSDEDIYDLDAPAQELGAAKSPLIRPVLRPDQHAYDALKLMAELGFDLLAVTDEQGQYLGAITLRNLAVRLSEMAAIREPGGILVLDVNNADYSLAHIAQIVEGNDSKILSSYVRSLADSNRVEVTIKVNREDLTRILQTFARYNYTVKASFHQSEFFEDLKRRYDEFMNYINI